MSSADASALYWSTVAPSLDASGVVIVVPDGVGGYVWQRWESGSMVASAAMPAPDFAVCSRGANAADGIALGFAVAGVWVAAWAISVLRRAMR